MKVSAPQFMSSSARPADAPADAPPPTPDTPADPSAPPPPPEPPKQATWPEWFIGVDNSLIVLALLFAFLMGSFAARNSDIFRHMAGGQRLLNGTYSLGSDPFSFTGAEANRPWVNQSWLFDLTVYAAYSLDNTGAAAVVLKAVVFAAAFGVLLGFRRPGTAGWPWAVMILAGALAASGTANLRPVVFGTLFGSLLLLLVFQGDWSAARWKRTLATVGGVCWLWGGFDSFAILGPVLVLVVALGEWVQRAVSAAPTPDAPASEPELFAPPPPPKLLLLAAAVGLLGVLLNPTFVIGLTKDPASAVAQLVPAELGVGVSALADDPEFKSLGYTVLTDKYWELPSQGRNAGSVGGAVLILVGAVALAAGVGRLPGGWLALWFATLLPCFLVNYRFIPLFAVVAVPLVAGLLNAVSARFTLGTTADGRTQGLLVASRLGRILTVPAFLVLLAATIPGWLHPALARRLEWRIDPDEAAVRGLAQLQRWREAGDLPADARGLMVYPDLADYAAWFAPSEPVFANTRYRFHAAELDDLVELRAALLFPPPPDADRLARSAVPVADARKAEYMVFGRPFQRTQTQVALHAITELSTDRFDLLSTVWHLDGRTVIFGRSNTPRAVALRGKLAQDPARLAFAPQAGLPDGPLDMPLDPNAGWLATFLTAPPPLPAYRDDGRTLGELARLTEMLEEQKSIPWRRFALPAATGGWANPTRIITDAELALPLVVCRAARQGVSQTPDAASAYATLAEAYTGRFLPEFEPRESARQRLTAFVRAAARLRPPELATAAQLQESRDVLGGLFAAQVEMGHLDLARETVKELRKVLTATEEANGGAPEPPGGPFWQTLGASLDRLAPRYRQLMGDELIGKGEFEFEEQAKKTGRSGPPPTAQFMKKLDDGITAVVGRLSEEWDRRTRALKPAQRAILAWQQFGLAKAALGLLKSALDLSAENAGLSPADARIAFVTLELETGQLEQASRDLDDLDAQTAALPEFVRGQVAELKLRKLRLQGNFKAAVALLDELRGGQFPKLTDRDRRFAVDPASILAPLSAAAPPFGAPELLPQLRLPPNVSQDAARKAQAEFRKLYLDTHPVLAPGAPVRERLIGEAHYYYQRGILALYDGDMPAARASFAQTLAPQGVSIDAVTILTQVYLQLLELRRDFAQEFPSLQLLPQYIRMIDQYKDAPPLPTTGGQQ